MVVGITPNRSLVVVTGFVIYTNSSCMIPIHLDSFISFSIWRYEASGIHYDHT